MAKQVSISSRKMIRDSDIISAIINNTGTISTATGSGGITQNLQSVLSTGNQTTLAIDMRNATDDSVQIYTDIDGNLRIEGSLVVEGEVQAWTVGSALPATVWDSLGNHVDGTTIEYTNNTLTAIGSGGGVSTFIGLTDTPTTYTADQWLKVNNTGTGIEWTSAPTSAIWGSITGTLLNQIDLQTELDGKENSFVKNTGFNKDFGTIANTVSQGDHSHAGIYEPIFNKNTGFNKNYGTTSTTVAQGNHLHSIYEPIFTKNTGFNKNFGTSALTVSEGNHDHNTTYLGINSNAISATKWNTARTFDIIGDVTGNGVSFDGTANLTFTAIVGNDTHTHDTRYFTESESNSRFVNITGDTMTGDLSVNGNITATSDITAFSDARLKDNIRDLENISNKFKDLRPIRYSSEAGIEKIGLIAQEVEKLFPEFVIKGDKYLSLDYMKMITLCIAEIQKLNNKLDAIANR